MTWAAQLSSMSRRVSPHFPILYYTQEDEERHT